MPEVSDSKYLTQAAWDDVPHLDEQTKAELLASTPPYLRDARSKGIPSLGAGAIYPVAESEILVDPFPIPKHWKRCYGMDVGWSRTAVVWGAYEQEWDRWYLFTEHYQGKAVPVIHATAIKARGAWIPGVIDPGARSSDPQRGERLMTVYTSLGLKLHLANNSVEAGILEVWERLSTGRLKIFSTLQNWKNEYRLYRRDEDGKVVKEFDHLMDACLAGDTLVMTSRGEVPISDMVGTTGQVVTRNGAVAAFVGARKTIENSPVVSVEFENGRTVVCTPDHPFLTPHGWVQAQDMRGLRCYNGVSQRVQWSRLCRFTSFQKLFRSFKVSATTFAGSIFSATESACTELSGNAYMAGPSRRAATSTTKTKIGPTMTRETLNSSTDHCTYRGIRNPMSAAFRRLPLRRQKRGTRAQQGARGTKNIMSRTLTGFISRQTSPASIAEPDSARRTRAKTGSARTTARPGRAAYLALTTKNALAWFAAACLWSIATWLKPHARGRALVRCREVRDAGVRDVYCLTVPGVAAFAVSGGLVVHNTRYLILSGKEYARTEPFKQTMGSMGTGIGDTDAGY